MSEPLPPGAHLRFALNRTSSRGAQIGGTFGVAILLGGVGAVMLVVASRQEDTAYILYLIGGFLAAIGLLLLYSAIQQICALKTPQTVVEIDRDVLDRGENVSLYFQQAGPARFESLRANLVGEESWSTSTRNGSSRHVKDLGTFNLFDSGEFEVGSVPFERTVTVKVPADLPHASEPGHSVTWQLEVWGRVRRCADFQHVYRLQLRDAL